MRNVYDWFTRGGPWTGPDDSAPTEVVQLRAIGAFVLALVIVVTATSSPGPALHGHGLLVVIGMVGVAVGVFTGSPRREFDAPRRIAALVLVAFSAALLQYAQPHGIWEAAPYYIAIVAAMRLDRRTGALTLLVCAIPFVVVAAITGNWAP